jgi:hypothetical protein
MEECIFLGKGGCVFHVFFRGSSPLKVCAQDYLENSTLLWQPQAQELIKLPSVANTVIQGGKQQKL